METPTSGWWLSHPSEKYEFVSFTFHWNADLSYKNISQLGLLFPIISMGNYRKASKPPTKHRIQLSGGLQNQFQVISTNRPPTSSPFANFGTFHLGLPARCLKELPGVSGDHVGIPMNSATGKMGAGAQDDVPS